MNKIFLTVVALVAIYFITVSVKSDIILPPPGGSGGGSGAVTGSYAATFPVTLTGTNFGINTNAFVMSGGGRGTNITLEGTTTLGIAVVPTGGQVDLQGSSTFTLNTADASSLAGFGAGKTLESVSGVSLTEAGYLANVTSDIQTQLNLHGMSVTNANQVWSNVVVVNPTGNVLTNGILLTNAVKYAGTLASATRPILVWVNPGTYGTPTNTLPSVMWAVDNVSTYWQPGAVWWSGTAGGDAAWMFDDQTAARTNCHVYGRGRFFVTNDNVNVFYTDKESRIRFECLSMYVTDGVVGNTTASPFTWGGVTNDMDVEVHDYMESADYDAFYGDLAAGQRLRLKAKTVRSIGDIFEFSSDSPQWGNVIIDIDRAEQTATSGQASFLQMGGRVHARIGQIKVASTVSAMAANGATNGILQGAIIELPPNGTRSVIQDNSGGSWHTGLWLRDCVLIGPTNVDALTLTNIATVPTILENTTIRPGWASTNWARGATPSTVKIVGGFNLDPYKPLGSQVTVISTNYLPAIRNIGTLVQHGQSWFSNAVNVVGADVTVGGGVYSDLGVFSNITAAIQFNLPNGAGPYTPADGDIFFDNDYWGAGRGAFVSWDGTANVVIPAMLQSDTPVNGQVLTFNTGGTWTAETPSAGGGGTNFHSLNISNHFSLSFTNVGSNAVQGFDLMGPSVAESFINGNTTWVITNMPAWTNMQGGTVSPKYEINARHGSGTLTLASLHPIDFGEGGLFLASGATNIITIQYINGRVVGSSSHRASTGSGPIVLQTNATIYTPITRFVPTVITGVGGANTNFTLLSTYPEISINGFTNVSIRAVMNYSVDLVDYWTCVITNGSGSARTLEFSAVTNNWRFNGVYGTNAPNTLTNATRIEISGRQHGTNVQVLYSYTPWP